MKTCYKCKIPQCFSEFRKCSGASDGLQSWCKACFRTNDVARYKYSRGNEMREYQKRYRKANKDKTAHWTRMRDARKLKATPDWLTLEQIKQIEDFYWLAKDCGLVSGEEYQVDHIIPIKGKDVCGLHVPWNLQVLPADINKSKGNRM
jgi:hypothetical protein